MFFFIETIRGQLLGLQIETNDEASGNSDNFDLMKMK